MYAKLAYSLSLIILMSATAAAVFGSGASNERRSTYFWESITYLGTAVEHYDSLPGLVQNADAVIVGRLSSAVPGRIFGDPPDDAAFYVAGNLEVEEVLFVRSFGRGASRSYR